MSDTKMWGAEEFWGLSYDFDPQWLLTPEQRELQSKLIELCQSNMRDNAVGVTNSTLRCDRIRPVSCQLPAMARPAPLRPW